MDENLRAAYDALVAENNRLEAELLKARGKTTYSMEEVFNEERWDIGARTGTHCRCGEEEKYGACLIHTVKDHYHQEGCCDQPAQNHRVMTEEEFEECCPSTFEHTFEADGQKYRVSARRYPSGESVTMTTLFKEEEYGGLCYDFPIEALPGIVDGLVELQNRL